MAELARFDDTQAENQPYRDAPYYLHVYEVIKEHPAGYLHLRSVSDSTLSLHGWPEQLFLRQTC